MDLWETLAWWPVRVLLVGGLVLLVGRLLLLVVRQPSRRVWLGSATAGTALAVLPLSLLPGWMPITWTPEPPTVTAATAPVVEPEPMWLVAEIPHEPTIATTPVLEAEPKTSRVSVATLVVLAYAAVVLALLGRIVIGHVVLGRWWRHATPAAAPLDAIFREQANALCPHAQLRVSPRVPTPMCFGLWRPCVLVPATLAATPDAQAWRCVLAHELNHLQRRDPLTAWLLSVARSVYFVCPWLGSFRRHVRLAQEYLADAEAVRWASSPADYAELLLNMIRHRAAPARAVGVRGTTSDLYRRVTMLLRNAEPVEVRCPRRWALAIGSGLTAVAIGTSGLYLQPTTVLAAPAEQEERRADAPNKFDQVEQVKKVLEKLRKDLGNDNESVKLLERTLKQLEQGPGAQPLPPIPIPFPVVDGPAKEADELQRELIQMQALIRRQMEEMLRGRGAIGGVMVAPQPGMVASQGRLGIRIERPTDALVAQLDLPNGRGLVCVDVPAESVAGKAGIKPHDILLEVDGKPVPSDGNEFVNSLRQIKADQAVDIVVLRKGRKETIKAVKLPEAREVRRDVFDLRPLPLPPAPIVGDVPPFPGPGNIRVEAGPGESIRVERFNDAFTVFMTKNGVKLTMTGSKEDGSAKAEAIEVEVDGKTTKYESIDKLPKEYQELAQRALKALK